MTSTSNRIHDETFGRLPDFIGVGPPRTATTWLHEVLSGHVGLPDIKETDFFASQYDKGLKWYAAHFLTCSAERPIGEFSPNYFIGKARDLISRHIPGCKIICTLRDPVERTYSHYRKGCEGGYMSGSFEDCLEKRPDLLEWSKYGTHVSAWQRLFGTDNVLVVIQDDVKADAQAFVNRVADFLQIPRFPLNPTASHKMVNAIPTRPRNPRIARAARVIRDGLHRHGDYNVVKLLKRTGLRNFLFSGGLVYEAIHPETEARLRELFRTEVEALEQMLGRDLSAWKASRRTEQHDRF